MRAVVPTSPPAAAARLRVLAAFVAGGLVLAPFAPWYVESVTAPAVHGTQRMTGSLSGWQSLAFAPVACALVGLALIALLGLRGRTRIEGLGAVGRQAARARLDGMLVTAGGALCLVLLLGTLVHHPGPDVPLAGATSATGLRSGVVLAGLLALTLVTSGIAITRAAALAEYGAHPAPLSPRPDAARTRTAPSRSRSPGSPARSSSARR